MGIPTLVVSATHDRIAPREALAQFDLDEAAAIEADPAIAALLSAGLAKR